MFWYQRNVTRACRQRNRDVPPVSNRSWRHRPNQQIASHAAGVARDERQHAHTERIEFILHAGRCAAEGEHERPDQIEGEEERGRREQQRGRHR